MGERFDLGNVFCKKLQEDEASGCSLPPSLCQPHWASDQPLVYPTEKTVIAPAQAPELPFPKKRLAWFRLKKCSVLHVSVCSAELLALKQTKF